MARQWIGGGTRFTFTGGSGIRTWMMCWPLYCEDNGDKGFFCKEVRRRGHYAKTYTEQAEHDDAPDSAASVCRRLDSHYW